MNNLSPLLAFAVTALVIEITPGPNMTYLAALSLSSGMRTGFAAVAGIALGLMTYGIIAAFGLAAAIDHSPLLYGLLRWGGVAFLLWLAWEAWSGKEDIAPDQAGDGDARPWPAFRRGLITNLLNPKAAVFYVAVLPEFVRAEAGSVVRQTLMLSVVYVAIATLIHVTIVALAGSLQSTIDVANNRKAVRRLFALALVAIALWFAFTTGRSH
ncbi:LysE family translocator [Bradyrhizobium sp. AS23.2]|uniref:LysE family translocator n=1 Tax=Bradyrhizobium sp. AS23.2 TaxID=1680155 RepID=UPI00093B3B1F|nr:LysE family translocator [Bradyrhizobium sp. AS23.2]OKO84755.1 lysine transporter LysE [Bradyrhizobium sp. AS23.2]